MTIDQVGHSAPKFIRDIPIEFKIIMQSPLWRRSYDVLIRSHAGAESLMFNTVTTGKDLCALASTLGIIINIVIDDIADQDVDESRIAALHRGMFTETGEPTSDEVNSKIISIWRSYREYLRESAPLFIRYRKQLIEEWGKLLEAMRYSILVNTGQVEFSYQGILRKLSPNMHHVIKHVVDICFSPNWDDRDTDIAIDFARKAEEITRIGNWLKSWELELLQGKGSGKRDVSNGTVAIAIEYGGIPRDDLFIVDPLELVNEIKSRVVLNGMTAPEYLRSDAKHRIEDMRTSFSGKVPFVNLEKYLQSLSLAFEMQLRSSGEHR